MKLLHVVIFYLLHQLGGWAYCFTDEDFNQLAGKVNLLEEKILLLQTKDAANQRQLVDQDKLLGEQAITMASLYVEMINQAQRITELENVNSNLQESTQRQAQIITQLENAKTHLQERVQDQAQRITKLENTISNCEESVTKNVQSANTLDDLKFLQPNVPNDHVALKQPDTNHSFQGKSLFEKVLQKPINQKTGRQRNASIQPVSVSKQQRAFEEPVAFLAQMKNAVTGIGIQQNILFDTVPLNLGGGFHVQHGLFIVPQSGIYMLSCSLSAYPSNSYVHAEIVKDGTVIARISAHGDPSTGIYEHGSQTVVAELQIGNEVWIRNFGSSSQVHGGLYSTFSDAANQRQLVDQDKLLGDQAVTMTSLHGEIINQAQRITELENVNSNLQESIHHQAQTITQLENANTHLQERVQDQVQRITELENTISNFEKSISNKPDDLKFFQPNVEVDQVALKQPNTNHTIQGKSLFEKVLKESINQQTGMKRNTHTPSVSVSKQQRAFEGPIAFLAQMANSVSGIGINQNILFDTVPLNKGGGFHVQHGLFIVPQSGIYMLSCSLMAYPSNTYVHAEIVNDGTVIASIGAHGDTSTHTYDQGSQTVVAELQVGNEVWIRNFGSSSQVYGGLYSTFSGYLLWPM